MVRLFLRDKGRVTVLEWPEEWRGPGETRLASALLFRTPSQKRDFFDRGLCPERH
jgi:hypothetical protein